MKLDLKQIVTECNNRKMLKLIKEYNLGSPRSHFEEVNIEMADRPALPGVKYYYYAPEVLQDNSRDFCIEMVNLAKVFNENEINFLSYKFDYDVLQYAGGYNCQHRFVEFKGKRIYTPPVTANQMRVLTQPGMPYDDSKNYKK